MTRLTSQLRRVLLAGLLLCGATAGFGVRADTDLADLPMAVANNAPTNFMFMVDNSGSMSNIVPDAPYSASAASSLGGACTASNQKIPTNAEVSLRVVSGVPKVQLAAAVGSGRTATDCSSGCDVGTGSGQVCFDEAATEGYSTVRLLATGSCGSGCLTASGASYLPAAYTGHYLNWYFRNGTLSGWSNRKPGTATRMEIAKAGTKAALDTIPLPNADAGPRARVGLATFNGGDGGMLLREIGDLDASQLASVKTSVDALMPTGSTPLAETLADIGRYYALGYSGSLTLRPGTASQSTVSVAQLFRQGSTDGHALSGSPVSCAGFSCPVQYWCQRSYTILMTDGRPQNDQALSTNAYLCDYDGDSGGCTTSGGRAYDQKNSGAASSHDGHLGGTHSYESAGSDYLDDVAQALRETDLRPDLTAPGGRAKSNNVRTYTVGFADLQAQNDPLLQETAKQGGGLFLKADNMASLTRAFTSAMGDALDKDGAAAAVAVTSSQLTSNNTSYMSSYTSGFWTGDLEAFSLDLASGLPITPRLWSAQAKLDALSSPATSRKIVSYKGSGGSPFTAANFANDSIGLSAGVIDFLRGSRVGEGSTYRARQRLLGDIINAEPVIVSYGSTTVVYQPANDGMVHAFKGGDQATDGSELWAFVPSELHPALVRLSDPNYVHRYYVDATPAVADVANTGFSAKVLVGGLGKGGRGYYALDISDPAAASEAAAASKVLWEKLPSDADSGFSFATPLIVKTPADGWLVLVTSGYNNGTSTGGDGRGHLWALDPEDGSIVRHVTTSAGSTASPAGLTHLARASHVSADQVTRYVYGGDVLGNVWRFDLQSWTAVKIAALADGTGAAQPVTTAPVVREVPGSTDKFFVYVGTGQYLGESDVPGNTPENAHATQTQSMYGILDDTSVTSPTLPDIRGTNGATCPSSGGNGDFLCQGVASSTASALTLTTRVMETTHRGWYFDLPVRYGRVNTHPAITTTGVLVFTVNVPSNIICEPGGLSWFFAVDAESGGSVKKSMTGSAAYEGGWFIGNALGSRPMIVETSGGMRALIRMSDRSVKNPEIPAPPGAGSGLGRWHRVYWRELM